MPQERLQEFLSVSVTVLDLSAIYVAANLRLINSNMYYRKILATTKFKPLTLLCAVPHRNCMV
jgi:hypothetical protein